MASMTELAEAVAINTEKPPSVVKKIVKAFLIQLASEPDATILKMVGRYRVKPAKRGR